MPQFFESLPSGRTIIVVPCFNEAKRLDTAAFESFLAGASDVTLLFVDDGSTDDTPLVLERLRQRHARNILTLRLGANVGKAEAVRRGIQLAIRRRAQFVGYWDADLATPLEAIRPMRTILSDRPDLLLVMGSRVALVGRQIHRHWRRHLIGRAFATAASITLGLPVYDTQCGAKLFRVAPETGDLFREPFRSRWIFDVEILARLSANRCRARADTLASCIYEQPLDRWQEIGGSRLKWRDFLTAAWDLTTIYRSLRRELRVGAIPPAPSIDSPAPTRQHRDAA